MALAPLPSVDLNPNADSVPDKRLLSNASGDSSPLQRQESSLLRQLSDISAAGSLCPDGIAETEGSVPVAQRCEDGHGGGEIEAERIEKTMGHLEELLAKLNPTADEFAPSPLQANHFVSLIGWGNAMGACSRSFGIHRIIPGNADVLPRRRGGCNRGRRMDEGTCMPQHEEIIKRTVYVTDIDTQVTEEQLADLFLNCGQVVDCRICGDPNSILRFAFVEFTDVEGARAALSLAGTILGYYPVRVLPSKTAIAPVNPRFLPRSEDEREMCARTIYCTNIDKQVSQADVKLFFESICGEVHRMRLLGDSHHPTRIAFVEFLMAESAIAALNCSGVILGSLPIRVSPSKTPVRSRRPRSFS